MRRFTHLWRALLFAGATVLVSVCYAQDQAQPLKTGGDIVFLPGVGRIIGGFALTVLLAVGAMYAFRRYLPNFANRLAANGAMDVTAQSTLIHGVRYHIVNVAGQTVLVAEGKTGVAMTTLPDNASQVRQRDEVDRSRA